MSFLKYPLAYVFAWAFSTNRVALVRFLHRKYGVEAFEKILDEKKNSFWRRSIWEHRFEMTLELTPSISLDKGELFPLYRWISWYTSWMTNQHSSQNMPTFEQDISSQPNENMVMWYHLENIKDQTQREVVFRQGQQTFWKILKQWEELVGSDRLFKTVILKAADFTDFVSRERHETLKQYLERHYPNFLVERDRYLLSEAIPEVPLSPQTVGIEDSYPREGASQMKQAPIKRAKRL